jgi:hypothetical protein
LAAADEKGNGIGLCQRRKRKEWRRRGRDRRTNVLRVPEGIQLLGECGVEEERKSMENEGNLNGREVKQSKATRQMVVESRLETLAASSSSFP